MGHYDAVKRRRIEIAMAERKQLPNSGTASQRLEGERAVDARLAMVHVSSHSRQRHKVVTVIVLASVSTRLPWQNGHAVGRLITSLHRDSDIVGVLHVAFIKVRALFTNAHERADCRVRTRLAAVIPDFGFNSEQPDATPLCQDESISPLRKPFATAANCFHVHPSPA